MNLKVRLFLMNFLEFAAWGAYLTSMGRYIGQLGMGDSIAWFYSMQGIVSIFMPAIIGIIADRWVQAQKMMGFCHLVAGIFMFALSFYAINAGQHASFAVLFSLYVPSVAFYMPSLSLSYSVAYTGLRSAGMDIVKDYPPIRVFGTVGFICTMLFTDFMHFQANAGQFLTSGTVSIMLFLYSFTLPKCPLSDKGEKKTFVDAFGLRAFALFKDYKMAIFFIFSMLLGVCLQITNSFANPFINSFGFYNEFADTFAVQHTNTIISLSQISEICCILLIPFFMKRYGIKNVMLIAMFAWVLRFGLFAVGNPGNGVWMFILSMIVYGVAFDFFNISGSMFVDQNTDSGIRSSAQGLFMLMTNGIGATIGTMSAQQIINSYTTSQIKDGLSYTVGLQGTGGWSACWYIFASYALFIAVCFALMFRPTEKDI